jgi:arylsulfatase A-like enzyme
VILSDHGEEFGEHGRFQHGGAVFEESLRVPLLFYGPGRIPAGRRIDAPVSLIDIAPTLLDLVGVARPNGFDGASLQGLLLRDEPLAPRTLFAEARAQHRWLRPGVSQAWNPPLVAVRTPTTKFIVHRPEAGTAQPPVAFDLIRDPGEQSPQSLGPARAEALLKLVDAHLGRRSASDGEGAEALPPDLVGHLRRLGYVE